MTSQVCTFLTFPSSHSAAHLCCIKTCSGLKGDSAANIQDGMYQITQTQTSEYVVTEVVVLLLTKIFTIHTNDHIQTDHTVSVQILL